MVQEKQIVVPEISVIMSVYNGQDYLGEAIESILNQTFKNFELLIVNDASVDSSKEIMESYKDSRIVIISNEKTLGLAKSLNKALKLAKGEFIARMDADDIATNNRLEVQISQARFLNCDVLGSSVDAFNKDGKIDRWNFPSTYPEIFLKGLYSPPFAHPTVFFRKELVLSLMYNEDCIYAQDYELWSRMLFEFKISKVYNLRDCLLKYRLHENQVSIEKKTIQQAIRLNVFKSNLKHLSIQVQDESFMLCLLSNAVFQLSQFKLLLAYLKQLKQCKQFDHQFLQIHCRQLLLRFSYEVSKSPFESKLRYYYALVKYYFV